MTQRDTQAQGQAIFRLNEAGTGLTYWLWPGGAGLMARFCEPADPKVG